MSPRIPMEGKKFGRLTVLSYEYTNKEGRTFYKCKCDCGNKGVFMSKYLRNGDTKSCGCLSVERTQQMGLNNKKSNEYIKENNYIRVFFSNSDKSFICDKEDWEKARQYTWYLNNNGYVRACVPNTKKTVLFHNYILNHTPNTPLDLVCDHISGDRLDNRKCNLRLATRSQSCQNRGRNKNKKEALPVGVYRSKNKFVSYIQIDRVQYYLGRFSIAEEAIKARQEAEIKYFGEYRRATN